jgi:hypothetical protein
MADVTAGAISWVMREVWRETGRLLHYSTVLIRARAMFGVATNRRRTLSVGEAHALKSAIVHSLRNGEAASTGLPDRRKDRYDSAKAALTAERKREMTEMHDAGMSLEKVGMVYGLSRQRVWQVIHNWKPGGGAQ